MYAYIHASVCSDRSTLTRPGSVNCLAVTRPFGTCATTMESLFSYSETFVREPGRCLYPRNTRFEPLQFVKTCQIFSFTLPERDPILETANTTTSGKYRAGHGEQVIKIVQDFVVLHLLLVRVAKWNRRRGDLSTIRWGSDILINRK